MTKLKFMAESDELLAKAFEILNSKAAYSKDEDALCAFKEDAKLYEVLHLDAGNPRHCAIMEIVKKVRRLVMLEQQGWPKGVDGVEDSHIDIINYVLLHHGLVVENIDEQKNIAG